MLFARLAALSVATFLPLTAASATPAATPPADPFTFTAPANWRSERIPFPLEFAPELKYIGHEDLRFAPGMFDAKAATYFSYVFLWWIDDRAALSASALEADLAHYFRGLMSSVSKSKKITVDIAQVRSKLANVSPKPPYAAQYAGTASTPDAFGDGKVVALNVEIAERRCPGAKRIAVFFALSPQPVDTPLWETMRGIRDSFRCESVAVKQ